MCLPQIGRGTRQIDTHVVLQVELSLEKVVSEDELGDVPLVEARQNVKRSCIKYSQQLLRW